MKRSFSVKAPTRAKQCRRRRCGISQREYDAREDLLELHALVDSGLRPAQIAREMGKDPAWVSRSIRLLREDPTLTYRAPVEGKVILQTLMRFDTIYQQAMRSASECEGAAKAHLLKVAASTTKLSVDYMFRVGVMEHHYRPASMDTIDDRIKMAQIPEQLGQGMANEWS